MDAIVAERTIHFTKQALFEKLLAERVPSGPVRTALNLFAEHVVARTD
jgi:hypothetical protein